MSKTQKLNSNKKKLSPAERLLRAKADRFIKVEKSFWEKRYSLEEQYILTAETFDLKQMVPKNLASIVWGLNDGVAFVRYSTTAENKGNVEFRAALISLEQWGESGMIIPTSKGEISLARTGLISGPASVRFSQIKINDVLVPYAEISHARYDSEDILEPDEMAIVDFQLTLLGSHVTPLIESESNQSTIDLLEEKANEFEKLLGTSDKEEALQVFLKKHPLFLHPTAVVIPKQKLGAEFITDFVLVNPSDQGPVYHFIEIEKASHKVLTKHHQHSAPTSHAMKQIRDWDIWLESHKAYLKSVLPGLESPKFKIIIGRSKEMDDTAKAHLRSYNRDSKNTELLTYDDVLTNYRSLISSLKSSS